MGDILQEAQENLRRDSGDAAVIGPHEGSSGPILEEFTEIPSARISDFLPDLSFLLAQTGPGSVDEYVDHPMNSQRSRGMAQMLRGFTGIAGQLDYAIVDIALGAMNYMKEGKSHAAADQ